MSTLASRTAGVALTAAALVGTLAASAAPAQAQANRLNAGPYEISAVTGYQWFDESAALDGAPILGLQIRRTLLKMFTAGIGVAVSRPLSRGDYFPWNRQVYFSDAQHLNDTTLLFEVSQRTTIATYAAEAGLRLGGAERGWWRGLSVDGTVALGRYVLWADPERARENRRTSAIMWQLGGGARLPIGSDAALLLRIDDVIFTNYSRDFLSLSDPLFAEDLFPNPLTTPPAKKTTIHNPRLTIGFTFVPGEENP